MIKSNSIVKFFITLLVVCVLILGIDAAVGVVMDRMLPKISNQGDTGKTYFSLYEVHTPILIVGSSRAAHHYVTQMIEDSIGLSTYNVGRDGCFFNYNCCVIHSILDRYTPKLIIWENGGSYLSEEDGSLNQLYPYYGKNKHITKAIQEELPWTERVRLLSSLYRYNSIMHRIVLRYVKRSHFQDGTAKGYLPLAPKEPKEPLVIKNPEKSNGNISATKEERFRSVIERAKALGVQMIVVDSPKYILEGETASQSRMQTICESYGVPFIDNKALPIILDNRAYFNDYTHMNDNGAKVYTAYFLQQIKEFIAPLGSE